MKYPFLSTHESVIREAFLGEEIKRFLSICEKHKSEGTSKFTLMQNLVQHARGVLREELQINVAALDPKFRQAIALYYFSENYLMDFGGADEVLKMPSISVPKEITQKYLSIPESLLPAGVDVATGMDYWGRPLIGMRVMHRLHDEDVYSQDILCFHNRGAYPEYGRFSNWVNGQNFRSYLFTNFRIGFDQLSIQNFRRLMKGYSIAGTAGIKKFEIFCPEFYSIRNPGFFQSNKSQEPVNVSSLVPKYSADYPEISSGARVSSNNNNGMFWMLPSIGAVSSLILAFSPCCKKRKSRQKLKS